MHIVLLICCLLTYAPPAQDATQFTAVVGKSDLQRLFSSTPIEVIFKIKYPDEAEIRQTIPIVYQ